MLTKPRIPTEVAQLWLRSLGRQAQFIWYGQVTCHAWETMGTWPSGCDTQGSCHRNAEIDSGAVHWHFIGISLDVSTDLLASYPLVATFVGAAQALEPAATDSKDLGLMLLSSKVDLSEAA